MPIQQVSSILLLILKIEVVDNVITCVNGTDLLGPTDQFDKLGGEVQMIL